MTSKDAWRVARFPDGDENTGITAKIVVDQNTMKSRTEYYIGDEPCKAVTLQSQRAHQLSGYAAIQKDLKFVAKAISRSMALQEDGDNESDGYAIRSEDDETGDLLKALYVSFVVTYGKCFVTAHRRRVKLEPKQIFAGNKKMKAIHVELMLERHEFVAHGGDSPLEQYQTAVLLHPDPSSGLEPSMVSDTVHVNSWGAEKLERYSALTEFVREQVTKLLNKKSDLLYQAEVAPIPLDDWYSKADK